MGNAGIGLDNIISCVKISPASCGRSRFRFVSSGIGSDSTATSGLRKQHFLYFCPDPHGHNSFLPVFMRPLFSMVVKSHILGTLSFLFLALASIDSQRILQEANVCDIQTYPCTENNTNKNRIEDLLRFGIGVPVPPTIS
jgi:hypothetical protein